jgi:predicted metal-dependent phosphoesterase TrpH
MLSYFPRVRRTCARRSTGPAEKGESLSTMSPPESQAARPRMVRMELHCHTIASSDGLITYDGLVKICRQRTIDVVCITDHDTIDGALEFQQRAQREGQPFEIVVGEERTLDSKCHLIGLFLRQPIRSTSLSDVIEEIRLQGGVVLVPHPYRKKDGLLGPRGVSDPALLGADGYEIHNAKGSFEDNQSGRERLAGVGGVFGGSDAHYEADVGQCLNVLAWQGTAEATIRAMLTHRMPFSILARPQRPGSGERRYAPAYYAVRRHLQLPRFLLPAAKQLYRCYWNRLPRNRQFPLVPVHQEGAASGK